MPAKDGDWTDQERIFAKEMARTSDALYSAEKAGYRHPSASASRLLKREPVMAEVRRKQAAHLHQTLVPLAYGHLETVLRTSENDRVKNDAAKIVLAQAKGLDEGGAGKELHEMSFDELQTAILAGNARLAALQAEQNVIEHEPEAPAETPEQGIFG